MVEWGEQGSQSRGSRKGKEGRGSWGFKEGDEGRRAG